MTSLSISEVIAANRQLNDASAHDVIEWAHDTFGSFTVASSLSLEDIALSHLVTQVVPTANVFSIDTGRLHEETYKTLAAVSAQQSVAFDLLFPESEDVKAFVSTHGINGFYDSVAARKACCQTRKVLPLQRHLTQFPAWVTGMRKSQSQTRASVEFVEYDAFNGGMTKINPIANWERSDVVDYIRTHALNYNPLQDQGFASIGCAPCSRAIVDGEHERSGRWWWEAPEDRECGIHQHAADAQSASAVKG